ncbi:MAG: PQQ-dependent sugar dehydrogenase, partial [Planctomycetales bacterium]|nr:PQQ-dependent sugar dehydrogenase [Planctomycetales bacterium]
MKTLDLYLLLCSFTITVAFGALTKLSRCRDRKWLIVVAVALGAIPANSWVAPRLDPHHGLLDMFRYLIGERDWSSIAAVAMGFAAGGGWILGGAMPRRRASESGSDWSGVGWSEVLWSTLSIVVVVGGGQAYLWKDVLGITRYPVDVAGAEYQIEVVANLDDEPLRLAADDSGNVFVCFDYFKKHGAVGGAILRFGRDRGTDGFQQRTVVESPFLARCYGLAAWRGDLYVSRSGFYPRMQLGEVTYADTGAVTQLKDLDGDGYFEYAHDIVTGLPGMRAPDTMQQNNGILFDDDGSLYVTNASTADRTLNDHPWGSTILKYPPDFRAPEVFAKGFRNPWTIAFGPDRELFATDSDVDKNPGDEINHVVRDGHYGHPFVIPGELGVEAEGFRDPMVVGERESVFLGLTYPTSASFPPEYRDHLFVTDFRLHRVL